ncbi:glycosyltransferase [Candidatus Microgenomates bacterium]|nr:MAG: glycosyltransferase [Candidatus Microgenomates bacterium]
MKIAFYDPYLDTMGGGEKYMLTAALSLAKDNEIFIFWDKDYELIRERAKQRFNFDLAKVKFVQNIFSPRFSIFKRMVLSRNFDAIVYLSDGSLPFLITKKLIVHFQFPVEWVKNDFLTKIKMRNINKVICNSYFTKSYIDKKFGIKSSVLYPPCQLAKKIISDKVNQILTVGRFNKNKNGGNFKKHDFLIETFKKMVDEGIKNWVFNIAISFKEEDKDQIKGLENLAKGYPINIYKNVNDETLKNLYSKAKIYWHASGFKEDLNFHPELAEHFGIATVEAMSYGAVPIVIKAGGQIEIVEDSKNGYLWQTQAQLVEKTEKLINDNTLLKQISNGAIERSQNFGLKAFTKGITHFLE